MLQGSSLTTVDIGNTATIIRMDITINEFPPIIPGKDQVEYWRNIFVIGNDHNRQPGVWVHPLIPGFHVSFQNHGDTTTMQPFNTLTS